MGERSLSIVATRSLTETASQDTSQEMKEENAGSRTERYEERLASGVEMEAKSATRGQRAPPLSALRTAFIGQSELKSMLSRCRIAPVYHKRRSSMPYKYIYAILRHPVLSSSYGVMWPRLKTKLHGVGGFTLSLYCTWIMRDAFESTASTKFTELEAHISAAALWIIYSGQVIIRRPGTLQSPY